MTSRSTVCHSDCVTDPVSTSTPELALYELETELPTELALAFQNNASPLRMPPMISTVALSSRASLYTSTSVTLIDRLTMAPWPFSVYIASSASTPPSTGASFTATTDTVRLTAALLESPSPITNTTVRLDGACDPVGSSDELLNCTARSADCHAATDALPDRVSAPELALNVPLIPSELAAP